MEGETDGEGYGRRDRVREDGGGCSGSAVTAALNKQLPSVNIKTQS